MRKNAILTSLIFIACISGCAAPSYRHEQFKEQNINRIVVLPYIDNRQQPDPDFNFMESTGFMTDQLVQLLRYNKRYRTLLSGDIGNVSSYSAQDTPSRNAESNEIEPQSINPEWVKQLGPDTEQWLLVPVLDHISHFNVLIQAGANAKLSFNLFNKQTGELWWWCDGRGDFSAGILIYGLAGGASEFEKESARIATHACMNALPARTGPFMLGE